MLNHVYHAYHVEETNSKKGIQKREVKKENFCFLNFYLNQIK